MPININDAIKMEILAKKDDAEQIEDWEYLLHHIQIIEEKEELHHCFLLDHLGNKFKLGHIKDEDGKIRHCIVGLEEDQDVYWSDQEAKDDGMEIPCANRQL